MFFASSVTEFLFVGSVAVGMALWANHAFKNDGS